jgi:hypothetical protein
MNYQNIDSEIKNLSEHFKLSQNTISKLANYYKEVGKSGIKFAEKIKKLLDEFYIEILKEERNTTYNKLLTNFYKEKRDFIEKIKIYFTNIEKNYGDKLLEFEKDYKNKFKDILVKLGAISANLTEEKTHLDKWKNQYFNFCKTSIDIENKFKAIKNIENEEFLLKLKTQYNKNEEIKKLKKKNYQNEQLKLNKLLEINETNYLNLANLIEKEYINKMTYVNNIIKDSNQNSINFLNDFSENLKKIGGLNNTLNAKNDWKSLKKLILNFSFDESTNKEKRFLLEEFLDYDSIKFRDILSSNNINKINDDNSDNKINRARNIMNMGKLYFIDLDNLNNSEKEINEIILRLILDESKISNDDFLKVINYIENNENNCCKFIDILATHFCVEQFIAINNCDNFFNLINIIVVILNYSFDNKKIFDICFLIIFIAEKCIFIEKNGNFDPPKILKFFEFLSQKSIFSAINFWKNLIDLKIDIISKLDINKEFNKRIINMNKNKKNNDIEKDLMLKQIFQEKIGKYFTAVFYSFLKHFTHFNFYQQEQILISYTNKYSIDKNITKFFNLIIKSDNIFNNQKKLYNKKKKHMNNNLALFDYLPKKEFKKIDDKCIKCILFSLKYLSISEYRYILCLSKKYYSTIINTIYKQILLKKQNLDIKTHLKIWKIILNYNQIKSEFNYHEIVESIKNKNKKISSSHVIELDIARTPFNKNKEKNIIKLGNILKSISLTFPQLDYYQGMNQIGAFLLNICEENDEEAFYIFAGIIKYTNYTILFGNNLEKMSSLFYTFDRLLNLYLPEIYIFFNQSNINAGYFISSWYITLFTKFYIDSNKGENNAKSIMLLLDAFFFAGWKIAIKAGILILKQEEKNIFGKLSENLLIFLTSLKPEILENSNFEKLRKELLDEEFKIKKELIYNIEEEFNVKKNIQFFKEGNKINSAF